MKKYLETGDAAVPGCKALRVLGSDTGCRAVGSAEDDRDGRLAARHVVGLGGRVDDLFYCCAWLATTGSQKKFIHGQLLASKS